MANGLSDDLAKNALLGKQDQSLMDTAVSAGVPQETLGLMFNALAGPNVNYDTQSGILTTRGPQRQGTIDQTQSNDLMLGGLFGNTFRASPEEEASAELYSMMGTDVPALGQTSQGETAAFQPITLGEGGTTMIDTSAPATQADLMQAGLTGDDAVLPLVGTGLVSAGAAKLADEALRKQQTKLFNQLYRDVRGRFVQGAKPVTRLDVLKNLGSRLGALRGASGMAGMVNPYTATAAGLLALEEAPKLVGDKSTSEILTELAATTPEERAGAAEYAALGTDVAPLGGVIDAGVVSKPPAQTLSQFMRYEDRPEQRTEQFVDPQGRIRRRMISTGELAPEYKTFEDEAEDRIDRIEAKPDFMEAQRTGQPRGQRRYTDAQIRDLFPDPDDRKAAKAMDASGFDPVQKKSYADIEAGQAAQEAGFETEALRQQKMKLDIEELKKAGLPDDVEVVTDQSGLTLLYRNGQLFNAFRSQASQFTPEQMQAIITGENPFSTVKPTDGNAAVPLGPVVSYAGDQESNISKVMKRFNISRSEAIKELEQANRL